MPTDKKKRLQAKARRGAPWLTAELKLLGKLPDSVLARRWRRTIEEVVAMRENRRIAMKTGSRRWTRREILLLGTLNDFELARRLRRRNDDVRRLDRPIKSVQGRRQELKRPAFGTRP